MKKAIQVFSTALIFLLIIFLVTLLDEVLKDKFDFSSSHWVLTLIIIWHADDFHRWLFGDKD
jgi:ABC-type transport system involved in cytochrome bd biosynthesis fused ATPase/permease subunit